MPEPTIHYVYEDEAGPIASGGSAGMKKGEQAGPAAGLDSVALAAMASQQRELRPKKLRMACNAKAVPTYWHRITNSVVRNGNGTFAVNCPACLQSEKFLKDAEAFEQANGPAKMFDAQGECCG